MLFAIVERPTSSFLRAAQRLLHDGWSPVPASHELTTSSKHLFTSWESFVSMVDIVEYSMFKAIPRFLHSLVISLSAIRRLRRATLENSTGSYSFLL